MEQIKIVRRRSRVVPIVITLIILALIVAAVLFLARDGAGGRLAQLLLPAGPWTTGNLMSLGISTPFAS